MARIPMLSDEEKKERIRQSKLRYSRSKKGRERMSAASKKYNMKKRSWVSLYKEYSKTNTPENAIRFASESIHACNDKCPCKIIKIN